MVWLSRVGSSRGSKRVVWMRGGGRNRGRGRVCRAALSAGRRLGVARVLVEDAGSQRAAGRCARRRLLHGRHGGSLKQREALGWKHKPRRARSCVGCRCDEALAFGASHQLTNARLELRSTPDVLVVDTVKVLTRDSSFFAARTRFWKYDKMYGTCRCLSDEAACHFSRIATPCNAASSLMHRLRKCWHPRRESWLDALWPRLTRGWSQRR